MAELRAGQADGPGPLAPEWEALFVADPRASPFQSPAWLVAWARVFAPAEPWFVTVREDGRLVGLAPFFVYTRPHDGVRQLTLLGNGISDRLDLLAERGREAEVAAAVFAHLAANRDRWDVADLRDLPAGSPLATTPASSGRPSRLEPEPPCPARQLPARPEDVLAALPRKRRENIVRRRRRLAELGAVGFETADAASLPTLLAALLDLHGARWRERGEAGVLADETVRRFHAEAAPALLSRGLLRLEALTLDGRVIAAHYGLRRGGCGYSYIHGFDPAFSAAAPSTLLIAHVLERAVADGLTRFDFLRGREPYKYDWGAEDGAQVRRLIGDA